MRSDGSRAVSRDSEPVSDAYRTRGSDGNLIGGDQGLEIHTPFYFFVKDERHKAEPSRTELGS